MKRRKEGNQISLLQKIGNTKKFLIELDGEPYEIHYLSATWAGEKVLPVFSPICTLQNKKTGAYASSSDYENIDEFSLKNIFELMWYQIRRKFKNYCLKHNLLFPPRHSQDQ